MSPQAPTLLHGADGQPCARMGLILYSILIFLGARGIPAKAGLGYCFATAAILMPFALAAIDDVPTCEGVGCDYSLLTVGVVGISQLALAFASFGAGVGSRWLVIKAKKK